MQSADASPKVLAYAQFYPNYTIIILFPTVLPPASPVKKEWGSAGIPTLNPASLVVKGSPTLNPATTYIIVGIVVLF